MRGRRVGRGDKGVVMSRVKGWREERMKVFEDISRCGWPPSQLVRPPKRPIGDHPIHSFETGSASETRTKFADG